ncbi:MAG: hypothetical protein NC177_06445 [Ruminococcus flavefaciens]|nr:hypothetical protein [Ruminococcus flavefaciens]
MILSWDFQCRIIWDNNWQSPVTVYSYKKAENFEKIIRLAIEQTEKKVIQKRFSYYGELWQTITVNYN